MTEILVVDAGYFRVTVNWKGILNSPALTGLPPCEGGSARAPTWVAEGVPEGFISLLSGVMVQVSTAPVVVFAGE